MMFLQGHSFCYQQGQSNPTFHATEMTNLIRMHASKHILLVTVARTTESHLKVSSLTLFRALDLDMLVCVRTCPYQSWTDIAERIMSTLNLAVSLARESMGAHAEYKNTLGESRAVIIVLLCCRW